MIKVQKVSKVYGAGQNQIHAIGDLSFEIYKGEFVMLFGPSGSGKTTILNIIAGLTRPSRGKVFLDQQNIFEMSDRQLTGFRARNIGLVFQSQSMLTHLNSLDNVRLGLRLAGKKDDPDLAKKALIRMGLEDRILAYANELSAGQQRRVSIARALVKRPKILLCDEPTGDLDPDTEKSIMEMLKKAHQAGTTILMVTHNSSLDSYATRVLQKNLVR